MAPMVAQSDLPFRLLVQEQQKQQEESSLPFKTICFTQMIHAANYIRDETFRISHLSDVLHPPGTEIPLLQSQKRALAGIIDSSTDSMTIPKETSPLIIQLAGNDPSVVGEAVRMIVRESTSNHHHLTNKIVGFDLNLGCPQSIARKGNYGAFLLEDDLDLTCQILASMRENAPDHWCVSAKIRIPTFRHGRLHINDDDYYYDDDERRDAECRELKRRIDGLIHDGKIDMLTIHGRRIEENKTRVGKCDWKMIREGVRFAKQAAVAAAAAKGETGSSFFPVIANGGMEFGPDILQCLKATGADGAMSSEGLLENPGIFRNLCRDGDASTESSPRDVFRRQMGYARSYLDLCLSYPPLPMSMGQMNGTFNIIRGHLFKFLYRYLEENHDLRSRLGDHRTITILEAMDIVDDLERRYDGLDDEGWKSKGSSDTAVTTWYRRHWGARVKSEKKKEDRGILLSVEERKEQTRERLKLLRQEKQRKGIKKLSGFATLSHSNQRQQDEETKSLAV